MKKKVICSVLLGLMVSGQLVGADYIKPKKDKKTGISYYDLNKNGHLDIYENPAFAVEERVTLSDDSRRESRPDAYFFRMADV